MATRALAAPPRRLLLLLTLALSMPIDVWALQWLLADWIPQGDQALAALRTHEVFSSHPPLLGMRSTSELTVRGVHAHHLGPMQFYVMAPFYLVSGWRPLGLLLACAAIAIGFIAISVSNAWRVGGWPAVVGVAACVVGCEFFIGAPIVLPWNPYPPILGLLAVIVLSWCLMRGRSGALPWWAACVSFVLQANLVYVPILGPLLLAMLGLGLTRWFMWRGTIWPLPGSGSSWSKAPIWRRPGVIAFVVTLLCWAPSIVELFVLSPNNAHEVGALFAGMIGPTQIVEAIAGAAAVGTLVWWTVRCGRPSVVASALCLATLGLAGLGAAYVTGGGQRTQYLFMGTSAAMFAVMTLVLAVYHHTAAGEGGRSAVRRTALVVGAAGLALAVGAVAAGPGAVLATPRTAEELKNSDDSRVAVERAVAEVQRTVFGTPAVEVLAGDYRATMGDLPAVMLQLQTRGYAVSTPAAWPNDEGEGRYDSHNAPRLRARLMLSDTLPPRVEVPWEWPAVQPSAASTPASPSTSPSPSS